MTDKFRRDLLTEQYGPAVRQWHPSVDDLIAAGERIERLDNEDLEGRKTA